MKSKLTILIYFIIGLSYTLIQVPLPLYMSFTLKALIIPVLAILVVLNLKVSENKDHLLLLAGLLFSWFGDMLLEVPAVNADLFIPGLISFLLAHVMYMIVFFRASGENIIVRKRPYMLIPVILFGFFLLKILYNDLGAMRIPVILYAIFILSMLAAAINRFRKVNSLSYTLVLFGAILFVISDSTIAINKFSQPFEASSFIIMSTYVLAQFLIITGYIRQFRKGFE